jgi:hypothetical protein
MRTRAIALSRMPYNRGSVAYRDAKNVLERMAEKRRSAVDLGKARD